MPENDSKTATSISEQLFQAIDAIVKERIRVLPYDKTVVATIIDNKQAPYGKYKVTTDDNITFLAYADTSKYNTHDKVYIRIPEGDYTKQKVITGRYIPDGNNNFLDDYAQATSSTSTNLATIVAQNNMTLIDKYEAASKILEAEAMTEQYKQNLLKLCNFIRFNDDGTIQNYDLVSEYARLESSKTLLKFLQNYEDTLEYMQNIQNLIKQLN